MPIRIIQQKTFSELYPTYQDWEQKVISRMFTDIYTNSLQSEITWLNDDKMFYTRKAIYNALYNKYKNYFSINDENSISGLLVNALATTLPALYSKTLALKSEFMNDLDHDKLMEIVVKWFNEDPETKFKSTETIYSETPSDNLVSGNFQILKGENKNVINSKDATVKLKKFSDVIERFNKLQFLSINGFLIEFVNSWEFSSLFEIEENLGTVKVISTATGIFKTGEKTDDLSISFGTDLKHRVLATQYDVENAISNIVFEPSNIGTYTFGSYDDAVLQIINFNLGGNWTIKNENGDDIIINKTTVKNGNTVILQPATVDVGLNDTIYFDLNKTANRLTLNNQVSNEIARLDNFINSVDNKFAPLETRVGTLEQTVEFIQTNSLPSKVSQTQFEIKMQQIEGIGRTKNIRQLELTDIDHQNQIDSINNVISGGVDKIVNAKLLCADFIFALPGSTATNANFALPVNEANDPLNLTSPKFEYAINKLLNVSLVVPGTPAYQSEATLLMGDITGEIIYFDNANTKFSITINPSTKILNVVRVSGTISAAALGLGWVAQDIVRAIADLATKSELANEVSNLETQINEKESTVSVDAKLAFKAPQTEIVRLEGLIASSGSGGITDLGATTNQRTIYETVEVNKFYKVRVKLVEIDSNTTISNNIQVEGYIKSRDNFEARFVGWAAYTYAGKEIVSNVDGIFDKALTSIATFKLAKSFKETFPSTVNETIYQILLVPLSTGNWTSTGNQIAPTFYSIPSGWEYDSLVNWIPAHTGTTNITANLIGFSGFYNKNNITYKYMDSTSNYMELRCQSGSCSVERFGTFTNTVRPGICYIQLKKTIKVFP